MEHVKITKSTRLTIKEDAEPLNPREQAECVVGAYRPITSYRPFDQPESLFDHPGNIAKAHDALWTDEFTLDPERNVLAWSLEEYGVAMQYNSGSYWFCDRNAFRSFVGTQWDAPNQNQQITKEVHQWDRYVKKQAKVATFERRSTFQRTTPTIIDEADLLHVWEVVDEIGDIYMEDYHQSYGQVIADHFGHHLTKKERAVVQAILDSDLVAAR